MNTTPDPSSSDAIEAVAAAWLARQDGEAWTADDDQALHAWLNHHTAHRVAWLRLHAAWQRADQMRSLPTLARSEVRSEAGIPAPVSAPASGHARSHAAAWTAPRRATRWAGLVMAAALLLGGGLLWRAAVFTNGEERYATSVGGVEAITLADGSRVTLNTRTRARALINEQERKVWLEEGEAFFEVQPDPARPFVVAAGNDRITVLGTKFSVRHEGNRTQVTVLEGRVRLDRGDTGKADVKTPARAAAPAEPPQANHDVAAVPTLMASNDAAISQAGGVLVMNKTPEQVQQHLSWRQGRLAFDQMTLAEIASEFNRYNRRPMVVEGAAAELRLGGSFDAHNAEGFARLMHEGFGLKVDVDNQRIRLSSP